MTTQDTSNPTSESSFSPQTERGERYDAVLALGKRIVEELEESGSADILARWMSHHIAELMDDAENTTGEDRGRRRAECADAILQLWSHRGNWPRGTGPFAGFDPIFRALESLDPGSTTPRYFVRVRGALSREEDVSESTRNWLHTASTIDETARMLIRYCISTALESLADKGKEWVSLATAAADEDADDVRVLEVILRRMNEMEPDPREMQLERLRELVERLTVFTAVAGELTTHLKELITRPANPAGAASDKTEDG